MVSSRKHPSRWIRESLASHICASLPENSLLCYSPLIKVPKGGHEKGESLFEAARRESFEEAGTLAPEATASPSPASLLAVADAKTLYHFFPLAVPGRSCSEEWPEAHERRREWVSYEEAILRLGEWADMESKGGKAKGGVRKGELIEGLQAWKKWREEGGGKDEADTR